MYGVKVYSDNQYHVYELNDAKSNSWVKVVPERGGIIIGFGVEGEEVLFLNKETLDNPEKNIRGGIPILFPISGQLENGEYEWNGKVYKMRNHGFARNLPWEVTETSQNENDASITIKLKSNNETMEFHPFEFEVTFTYILSGNKLTINQEYSNHSEAPMPIYSGFHPYFKTTSENLTYQTDAKTYLDYNNMQTEKIEGSIDLTGKKESLVLLDAVKKEISFTLPEMKKEIVLTYSDVFKYIVLWTEKDQDFICVEPWMALTNELNKKGELVLIQPGETLSSSFSISVK
ncbi:aldose epimerase [Neobacillus sp. PS3-40]|uniref:aldose epimerase family protein n=1 Tax=Neobacillus sp. PS3-40 TaxID=3070679 RepID=UPI0027DEB47D|nr:aldose epimerase [Neobacillus sp. PS3-40]WML43869.1 aldose epimerase [Neobacillus sp. PS3-40]